MLFNPPIFRVNANWISAHSVTAAPTNIVARLSVTDLENHWKSIIDLRMECFQKKSTRQTSFITCGSQSVFNPTRQ